MTQTKVTPITKDTYLAVIKNSIGSEMFRNFYAKVDDKVKDIMKNGELSCAFFVSSILTMFQLIKKIHGTVDGTIKDLRESGWIEIKNPRVGSVLVYESQMSSDNGEWHKHIGFYIGGYQAISNSSELKEPVKHHWAFDQTRRIQNIFYNEKLNFS